MPRCVICRAEYKKWSMSQKVCGSPECAQAFAEKERAKRERKADKVKRNALKTRSDVLKEAQIAFNAYIKERDKQAGYACISSGRTLDWSGNQVDAGHYRSTGAAPHLRFNEDNCHAQSKKDNRWLAGNAVDYRVGLIARIGLERVEFLEAYQSIAKWSKDDLEAIRDQYRAKLKGLKNGHS